MTALILAGSAAAQALLSDAAGRAARLAQPPRLALLHVGDHAASLSYARSLDRAGRAAGIHVQHHVLPAQATRPTIQAAVHTLNADPQVHGILPLLPLPAPLDEQAVLETLDPRKDVDGMHPVNVGRLWSDVAALNPGTPLGVLHLLRWYARPLAGQRAVIVGRSRVLGRPLAALLLNADATVTVAHRATRDLAALTREADLLIVAAGTPHLITPDMVQRGATVIDIGIHPQPGGKVCGDVHPDVRLVAGALSPVPGGVGPLTAAQLMLNTVQAAEDQAAAPLGGAS